MEWQLELVFLSNLSGIKKTQPMKIPIYHSRLTDRLSINASEEIILNTGTKTISTNELLKRSKDLAAALYTKGVRKNDRTVIAAKPGIDFLVIVYANMFLQTKVAIIDPEMGKDNYINKLKQWAPKWAFVDALLLLVSNNSLIRKLYLSLKPTGFYFPIWPSINYFLTGMKTLSKQPHITSLQFPKCDFVEERAEEHDFIVVYTSGTTSIPKAVLHSFNSLDNSFQHMVNLLGAPKGQRIAAHLPHFMLMGVNARIPVFMWNYEWSAKKKFDFITKNKITILFGPPSDYLEWIHYCEKTNQKFPSCLKHLILGSAPIFKPFLERLVGFVEDDVRITCFYGMTENLFISTIDGREKIDYESEGDPLGKPFEGVELKFEKDGELFVHSNQLFSRYYHMEDRPHFHASGDLAKLDHNGTLIMTGRKKDMILRKHMNIYPGLYEPTIMKIDGVTAVAMVGKYSEEKADEEVFLYVESSKQYSESEFIKLISQGTYSIDKEALPDYIVFMDLPRKGRQSKIDKSALAKL